MLFYNIDSCHKICLQCWNRHLVIFEERPSYVQVWSNRQKKTIKKCLKDIILYKPNKAHPQENMNKIFDKTKYQKKEKIMDFYYSFF